MSTNPYFTQYHTQRFSFIGSPQQRDGTATKDQRFVNMYPELIKSPISDGKKYYLKKRPGVSGGQQIGVGEGRGIYFWNNNYFICTGWVLYMNGTPIQNLGTSTGPVGFAEFRTDTQDILFFCDGSSGYIISTTGVSNKILSANFPTPHVPTPVFLDGYIFLASAGTQTIHNSTLLDPSTWPTDGFIDAEMFSDNIVALKKSNNYIAAIGAQSVEFFYDNGNPTGSPLQRNAPAVSQFGCPAPLTANQTEKEIILVAQTGNGGRTIWKIDGFQPTELANEPVRMALDNEGVNIANAWANTVQCAGHKWYILNLTSANRTFVYDFEEQMWHEWTSGSSQAMFGWKYMADNNYGPPAMLAASGYQAYLDANATTDLGTAITCQIITTKIDFDTIKRKRLYRLSLVGDSPNGNTNTPITVYWSDDDYNTWSSGVTLNINGSWPTISQLGYTRRRAFKFIYNQPYPLRLEAFEVDTIQEVRR